MGQSRDDPQSQMLERLERLEADNHLLRQEVASLRRTSPGGVADSGVPKREEEPGQKAMSRRGLLRGAGALAAGGLGLAAAETLLSAGPAAAANGDPIALGSSSNAATAPTGIAVTQPPSAGVYGFGVTDGGLSAFPETGAIAGHAKNTYSSAVFGYGEGLRDGIHGRSVNGFGVFGHSDNGIGVYGESGSGYNGMQGFSHSGSGVYGSSSTGDGITGVIDGSGVAVHGVSGNGEAIRGEITNAGSGYYAIHGVTAGGGSAIFGQGNAGPGVEGLSDATGVWGRSGTGEGVLGTSQSSDNTKAAIHGQHQGAGRGVWGEITNLASSASGVLGSTIGKGAGVEGASGKGRGGVFSGKVAQVRLKPSSAATHPTTGSAGDLFVDASNRLWFCTASGNPATWTRLA